MIKADNANQTVFYSKLYPPTRAAIQHETTQEYQSTDLVVIVVRPPNHLTDVNVYDQHYVDYCNYSWYKPSTNPTGVAGLVVCYHLTRQNECEKHELRITIDWMQTHTRKGQQTIACHEFGHTLGLNHNPGHATCIKDLSYARPHISAHDRHAINSHY
ncbi:MAG: hypothetical protein ACRDP4_01335 [Nocardioidaceae bacterium]